jgi:hypothetical protein
MSEYTHEYIEARWLLFLATPCRKSADADGRFNLGEVGAIPEKNWCKKTPYSPATPDTSSEPFSRPRGLIETYFKPFC